MNEHTILYMALADVDQLVRQMPITSSVLQIVYNQLSQEQKKQPLNYYALLYWCNCFIKLRDYYRQRAGQQQPDPEDYYQFSLILRNRIPDDNWIRQQILLQPYSSACSFFRLPSLFPVGSANPVGGGVSTVHASADQSCDIPTVQVTPPVVYPSPALSPYAPHYQGVAASMIPSVVPMTAHSYSSYSSGVGQPSAATGVAGFSGQASSVGFSQASPTAFSQASPAAFQTQASPAAFQTQASPAAFPTQSPPPALPIQTPPIPFPTQSSIPSSYGSQTGREPVPMTANLSAATHPNGSTVSVEVIKNQIKQKFNYDRIPDFDKLEFGITDTQNSQNTSQLSTV